MSLSPLESTGSILEFFTVKTRPLFDAFFRGYIAKVEDYWCMIKIFRGEGVVDGEGGSSEGCLKWGGGGCWVIKGSFQKHLKTVGG